MVVTSDQELREQRAEQLSKARQRITDRMGRVITIAGWLLAALGLWALVSYLLWVHERLAVGWHMLRSGERP